MYLAEDVAGTVTVYAEELAVYKAAIELRCVRDAVLVVVADGAVSEAG